jgi:hypothetical protein
MTKIMFIMFPGYGVGKKGWNHNIDNKQNITKTNFISELKKIGEVNDYYKVSII